MAEESEDMTVDIYGDDEVRELANTKIPKFLWFTYIAVFIWGIMWWMLFWNGSQGWLDRGYWSELEGAANTKLESTAVR